MGTSFPREMCFMRETRWDVCLCVSSASALGTAAVSAKSCARTVHNICIHSRSCCVTLKTKGHTVPHGTEDWAQFGARRLGLGTESRPEAGDRAGTGD